MNPYASPEYARALPHLGTAVELAASGTHAFLRPIETGSEGGTLDATGAYPLLACERWDRLDDDLQALHDRTGAVAFVGVTDPFGPGVRALRAAFPDLLRPFKDHQVVDLGPGFDTRIHPDHRRRARRAAAAVEVVPGPMVAAWAALYDHLRVRHGIRGAADFPTSTWPTLFAHPALRSWAAVRGGAVVAMALWLVGDGVAWYHLGASSPAGYEAGASYAVFRRAFEELAAEGVVAVDLGGSAGPAGADDGLARFKRRWGGRAVPAHLAGRVLDPPVYERLCGRTGERTWFPAYRRAA